MLQQVSHHPKPEVALEQYTIPSDMAAEIVFQACYTYGDIENKQVADLGSGTGRLALGAAMLGAEYVVGVDLDLLSLSLASRTTRNLALQVDWLLADIQTLRGSVDTVLMNPPFGTKQPHADIRFLQVALQLGEVVYSIHKSSTRRHIDRWLKEHATEAERIMIGGMDIPHQFSFHKMKKRRVDVDVFRIRRKPARD
jgi:predicted RNA methylase